MVAFGTKPEDGVGKVPCVESQWWDPAIPMMVHQQTMNPVVDDSVLNTCLFDTGL